MTDDQTTQRLTFEKETKRTYRYEATDDGEPIVTDTFYVKKWALGEDPPEEIRVTIQAVEAAE